MDFDEFDLGNLVGKIINLPGHTKGSIGIYFPKLKLILAGDALSPIMCLIFKNHGDRMDQLHTLEYVNSLEFNSLIEKFNLLEVEYVNYAFRGISACVLFLIIFAGIKMFFSLKKDFVSILFLILVFICLVLFSLFNISFSTVFYILIGGGLALLIYCVKKIVNKLKKGDKK